MRGLVLAVAVVLVSSCSTKSGGIIETNARLERANYRIVATSVEGSSLGVKILGIGGQGARGSAMRELRQNAALDGRNGAGRSRALVNMTEDASVTYWLGPLLVTSSVSITADVVEFDPEAAIGSPSIAGAEPPAGSMRRAHDLERRAAASRLAPGAEPPLVPGGPEEELPAERRFDREVEAVLREIEGAEQDLLDLVRAEEPEQLLSRLGEDALPRERIAAIESLAERINRFPKDGRDKRPDFAQLEQQLRGERIAVRHHLTEFLKQRLARAEGELRRIGAAVLLEGLGDDVQDRARERLR